MSSADAPPGVVLISRYDPEYAVRVERTLAAEEFEVELVESLREIRDRVVPGEEVALIVLTGGLAEPTTRDFLRAVEDASIPVAVLALVDELDPVRIERFRRSGIDEFLEKPFDPDEVALIARRLLAREELVGRTHIVGRSNAIKEVLERVAQYAPVHSTVMVEGESGTGKELVARAIHDLSPRSSEPFIPVNCAALTETLLESELFGHEKGAFTGATSLRKGRFEIADGGTLFLDEVGEMPHATQVKLLRVLEEKEFMRVGGSNSIQVDVRVIAATNKDLGEEVEEGGFRRDLFYRLNVLHVRMPPLRERREDVPLLIHHFVQRFCRENDRDFVGITDEAMEILVNYDWPGNVRELRNLVESMLVLTPGSKIRPIDIPEEIYSRAGPERLLPVTLREVEEGESGASSRRIEALLGWFYRDLKGELDDLRRDNAEIRSMIADSRRQIDWLQAVEVETEEGSRSRAIVPVPPEVRESVDSAPARPEVEEEEAGFRVGMSLEELERLAIERTLESVDGNRRKAAEVLGIGERTLYRKLKRYDLS
ncbi:MAG: sigma-54 dependent transcriptional regulator [Gemmatimonadetes bacterium]|nr:sigma-54 dependent transcriptional regulator [Gemmatimonadota bacterium]